MVLTLTSSPLKNDPNNQKVLISKTVPRKAWPNLATCSLLHQPTLARHRQYPIKVAAVTLTLGMVEAAGREVSGTRNEQTKDLYQSHKRHNFLLH